MKATEKKEIVQVFELERTEVVEALSSYLKTKSVSFPEKALLQFEVKVGPTSRDLELLKIIARFVEEGTVVPNGKESAPIIIT